MSLAPNEDEQMLVEAVANMLDRSSPVSRFRTMRDTGATPRMATDVWEEMRSAGFAAPQVPESSGGAGMGHTAAGLIARELGRRLGAVPIHSTAMAAQIFERLGREQDLAALVAGEREFALAIDETGRHAGPEAALAAQQTAGGYVLEGTKRFVVDGGNANTLLVSASMNGELALFAVPADAAGVEARQLDLVDSRDAVDIDFAKVELASEQLIATGQEAGEALQAALDVGAVMVAAELLGIAEESFERTVSYLKEREQFGAKIGSFQALQHRAARLYIKLELARGTVMKALRALDTDDLARSALSSLAKAVLTDTARKVMNEALQMHGGIGVTDDLDIGLFFKRARVAGEWLGDDHFHRERLARTAWRI